MLVLDMLVIVDGGPTIENPYGIIEKLVSTIATIIEITISCDSSSRAFSFYPDLSASIFLRIWLTICFPPEKRILFITI